MINQGNIGLYFKGSNLATRDSICNLLQQKRYTLDSLLAEVNGTQLYALVAVFRETVHWKKFLVALLRLSPETWDAHNIFPEYLQTHFTLEEKREILTLDSQMIADGRQSPLLPFLRFERLR